MSKHGGLLCFDLLQLGLLSPGATSVFGGDLFARKQGANAYGVFGLTLENDTVEAALVGRALEKFSLIGFCNHWS